MSTRHSSSNLFNNFRDVCAAGQKDKYDKDAEIGSFTEDEGRSFEISFQERVSNHLKQLLLRVMVVSLHFGAPRKCTSASS